MANPIPIDGKVLRDLRRLRSLSQEELANEAGLDRAQISRYECGSQQPPPAHLRWTLAALERIPVSLEQRVLIKTPALDAALQKIEDLMNRRQLAKLAAAGSFCTLTRIDLGEVSLHQATQDLIGRWPTTTPAESLAAARDLLNRQQRALEATAMPGNERRQLLADAVDAAILAGWSARFCDLPAEQAAWFARAEELADESGLATLRGEALASKATLHRPAPYGDDDVLAGLELARAAEPLVGTRGPLAKFVVSIQSEMHVPLDDDDALRALDRALALPDDGGRDGFYSRRAAFSEWATEQLQWAGDRYAQLGRPDQASIHFDEATAISFASPRTPVQIEAMRALAHALAANPEQMCRHAHLTLDGSRATGYEAGVSRVRFTRQRLPEPCDGLECVRELDERLATL